MEAMPEQKRPIASSQARLRFSSSTIAGANQTLPSLQISLSFHRPLKRLRKTTSVSQSSLERENRHETSRDRQRRPHSGRKLSR